MSTGIDSELARANLLRMRADFRHAEDLCLGILKRLPNSIAAHSLLGDIYSDQGMLEQAAQWYELALDLDPESVPDRQKLEDVREQIKERDHISSIEQLGLPEASTAPASRYILVGVAGIVLLLGFVYAARHGKLGGSAEPSVITTPIRAVQDVPDSRVASTAPTETKIIEVPSNPPATTSETTTTPATPLPDDRPLFQLVSQKSTEGAHLSNIVQDPRNKTVTLTYTCAADDDEHKIGATLAKTALEQAPDAPMITIRAMKGERLIYTADVPRARFLETLTDEWQAKSASPDAWVTYILTNEWPAKATGSEPPSTPPTTQGTTGSPASSSTGN